MHIKRVPMICCRRYACPRQRRQRDGIWSISGQSNSSSKIWQVLHHGSCITVLEFCEFKNTTGMRSSLWCYRIPDSCCRVQPYPAYRMRGGRPSLLESLINITSHWVRITRSSPDCCAIISRISEYCEITVDIGFVAVNKDDHRNQAGSPVLHTPAGRCLTLNNMNVITHDIVTVAQRPFLK